MEKDYTVKFKNWVKELLTEEQGQTIARENGLIGLELLYTKCTSKSATKKIKV